MNRWKGKIAVVTGASSGIGLAIAQTFVKEGLIVCGLARRKEVMENNMKNVKGEGKFYACKCDVTCEQEVLSSFNWIKQNLGTVQIMVNNAGLTTTGALYETSRADWEHVFNVNVMGLLQCTKQAILMMKEADVEGHIINMNSIQGHRVYKFGSLNTNVYAATKHAVTGLSHTLRNDLFGGKIKVTSISPGLVKTDILLNNGIDVVKAGFPILEPHDIADAIMYVINTPQRVQVTELVIKPLGEARN